VYTLCYSVLTVVTMASSLEKEIHDLMAAMTPVVSQENCAKT
jgi:hypothetical protein